MGSRVIVDLQGFVVPDRRILPSALKANVQGSAKTSTDSSYNEAGPQPGSAVADDTRSTIQPRVHCGQDVDLDITVIRGGSAEVDGASVMYQEAGNVVTDWRGWNEPNIAMSYHPLEWTTTDAWEWADAVTIPSTGQIVAVGSATGVATSSWTWTRATRTWGARVTVGASSQTMIAVCLLPQERILAVAAIPGTSVATYYSDDAGASWSSWSVDGLHPSATVIAAATDGIQLARDRFGNLLLIGWDTATGDWRTWVSTNGGASFSDRSSGSALGQDMQLKPIADGRLLLTYIHQTNSDVYYVLLDDAYDTITGGVAVVATITAGFNALAVDDDGVIYAVFSTSSFDLRVARSTDNAATWTEYTYGIRGFGGATSQWFPRAATASGGELVLFYNGEYGLTSDGSLLSIVLGGWSNMEADSASSGIRRTARLSPGYHASATWQKLFDGAAPMATQNATWALTGTATTLVSGRVQYSPAAATSYNTFAMTADIGRVAYLFDLFVTAGGSTAADQGGFQLRRANGVYDLQLAIRASTTGFRAYDIHGAASLGLTTIDMTTGIQILVTFATAASRQVSVFYRTAGQTIFTRAVNAATLTDGGALGADDRVRVGVIDAATTTMRTGLIWWAEEVDAPDVALASRAWGKSLNGLPYGVREEGTTTRMTRLSLSGARARNRETFSIPANYDYAVEKAFPTVQPSPRRGWRTTDNSEQNLVFDFGRDTALDHGWSLGVGFFGPEVPRLINVQARTSAAGAWTSLGSYDGAVGFEAVPYTRNGELVYGSSAYTGRYIWENEYAGGYAILDTTGTPVAHRIVANTAGYLRLGSTETPRVVVRLAAATFAGEPTTGVLTLVHPGGLFIVPRAAASVFRYLQISIDAAQVTPDGTYNIPTIVPGGLLVPGRRMGRGWSMSHAPRVATEEDDYGTLHARKRGPVRREFTWSYQEPASRYGLRLSTTPDYVAIHGSLGAEAAYGDAESRLAAALYTTKGGAVPIVALLQVPGSALAATITDKSLVVYGHLTGTVQENNVVGVLGTGEAPRIESMTLVELPWDLD